MKRLPISIATGLMLLFLLSQVTGTLGAQINNPPGGGGYDFYTIDNTNDAGFAYNLSAITFVTTFVNLTGTFQYNSTEQGTQYVVYYPALGEVENGASTYIQPFIAFSVNSSKWSVYWYVQAIAPNIILEYDSYGLIASGQGSSVQLNDLFNLTIRATLNSQGEITQAYVLIMNAKTGQVYFSQTVNLQYPIPDKQVFFVVEDPLSNGQPVPFPIIPSSYYVFTHASASNSSATFSGLPLYNGIDFMMGPPLAKAEAIPLLNGYGTQGVQYYW